MAGSERMDYGFKKTVEMGFEEAVSKTREALKEQGFGILTEIDVKSTLKEKLGIDTEEYIILGACNPNYAHKALEIEKDLGLLLPCNAVVYVSEGKTIVGVVSPSRMLEITGNPRLGEIAGEVEQKMKAALERV
jgi:uncharacterized protein (DUF302 family)